MNSKFSFNDHSNLIGTHALFSPSQSAWLRYDDEKIAERVLNQYRAAIGTEIHEYAAQEITLNHKITNIRALINGIENFIYTKYKYTNDCIRVSDYGMKLIKHLGMIPKDVFDAVRAYINDGTSFKMTAEQPIQYSDRIYGTADTLSFRNNFLRIHDLKSGEHPAKMDQLETYAALFCLEYGNKFNFKPGDIKIELRIYQWDAITIKNPTAEEIVPIMDRIIHTEKIAYKFDKEE
jgi:hypothetical protein